VDVRTRLLGFAVVTLLVASTVWAQGESPPPPVAQTPTPADIDEVRPGMSPATKVETVAPTNVEPLKVKDLPEHWRVWLEEEIYPLITTEQRKAFLRLRTEAQRQAFSERLWILWGRQTGLGTRLRADYDLRLQLARELFGNTRTDRARVLLIHGMPDFNLPVRCEEVYQPLEIWGWGYIEGLGENVVILFYRPNGLGEFRFWTGLEGRRVLYTSAWLDAPRSGSNSPLDRPEYRCTNGDQIVRLIAAAARWSSDPSVVKAMYQLPTRGGGGPEGSAARFMEFSALMDDDALPLDFALREGERGLRGGQVRMGFDLVVSTGLLGTTLIGDVSVAQVDVVGEISRGARMVDRFRYLFSVPAAGDELVLLMERDVRPGDYTIRVKVEDVHSSREGVSEFVFTADLDQAADAAARERRRRREVAAATVADAPGEGEEPILRLVGPRGEAVSGIQRFEAIAAGEVAQVEFLLDGRKILTKNRPPFDIDLNLGPLPRLTTVTVVGLDRDGFELARSELSLNVGRERFFIRLDPVSAADVDGDRLRVSMQVNTPSESALESLDVYWNDRLLTSLYQPPYEAWVTVGAPGEFGYLRAQALLEDGSQAEDVQFVNAPEFGSIVEVQAVELPVTVLGRDGRPVSDLAVEDFTVLEDGEPQVVSHMSLHLDMPVRLGIVIDSSGSMAETLPEVQRVVMGFLRQLLRPQDRAYIETFSDEPQILAPFTAEFDTLENALLALYADRSTALWDATIMGLFQYAGVRGRKAMVILSDGEDTTSRYSYDEVRDFAMRAGVTIYAIGIDLPTGKVRTRYQLRKLSEITGGRAFFITEGSGLDRIYEEIDRELRTQYLLAYTSSSTRPSDELREIEVEVDRRGLKVRTISGYFPGGF
jgi:Ca-activated chloride channel family protein